MKQFQSETLDIQSTLIVKLIADIQKKKNNIDQVTYMIISYVLAIGGQISEYNLVNLLAFGGFDFNNPQHLEISLSAFSYYCGARVIRIIDNDLGILELLMNPDSPSFQRGTRADVSDIENQVEKFRNYYRKSLAPMEKGQGDEL
ncbi:MAG TPA: hypothetical protein VNU45_05220 [Rummeliibacillus sp.]|nr:hypothetical protein [Rummeliibacillus sp.]